MQSKTLKKASRLFNAKKYNKVILVLEPQVFRYRKSFVFFYLLGISCLHTSDYGGGYSYLKRAIDLKPDDINTLAGIALVHLKRQESSEALLQWFKILDIDPNNKLAKRGMEVLKKNSKQEDLIAYLDSGRFLSLLPGKKSMRHSIKIIIITFLGFCFSVISIYYIYHNYIKTDIKRPEIAAIELDRYGSLTDKGKNTTFQFSDKEIRSLFLTIRKYFDSYHDNLAMREINRLLLSNADNSTKEKAKLLASYISIPGFSTLKTNFSYQEFLKNPKLYLNCYVHWKGRLSNLLISESIIKFDFLVGYDDKKVLEGIIPVTLDFGARINSDFPIEVLGKIVESKQGYKIEAVSVHQYQQQKEK